MLSEDITILFFLMGGAIAQSVKRATPGEEVVGSIPAETEVMVSPLCLVCGSM